jgi:hypothetical protein
MIAATTAPAMTPVPTPGEAGGGADEDEGEDVGDVDIGGKLANTRDGGTFSIRNDCMMRGSWLTSPTKVIKRVCRIGSRS